MILPSQSQGPPTPGPKAPVGLLLRHRLPVLLRERECGSSSLLAEQVEDEHPRFNIDEVDSQFFQISISHDGRYATAVAAVPLVPQNWSLEVDMDGETD